MRNYEKHGDIFHVRVYNADNHFQFLVTYPEAHLDYGELNRWPELPEFPWVVEELYMLGRISGPVVVIGLLLYLRGMISMEFLVYLGELELAGGSLSIGFANITSYSVIFGLAMGMEPVCSRAL
ncbi:hypothetical protein SUGI_0301320 [Cryptomeria japonica]|nr:hypothetical protein SUGI_0301320 [Cryptomeria japonica]